VHVRSTAPSLPERLPAVVVTPCLDVVTANDRWHALHVPFRDRGNLARMVFLDPAADDFFPHRRHEELDVVASLNEGARDGDCRDEIDALIRELSAGTTGFRRLSAGPRVRPLRRDRFVVRHPHLGVLRFTRHSRREGPYLVRIAIPASESTDVALTLLDLL
jgi:hypothetical protein